MHKVAAIRILRLLFVVILLFGYSIVTFMKFPKPLFVFKDIGIAELPDTFTSEIYGRYAITQAFVSNFSGFFRVGLFIQNSANAHQGELVLHLKESLSAKDDLVTVEISPYKIRQNAYDFYQIPPDPISNKGSFYYVKFKPIRESKDKMFYLSLEAPSCSETKGYRIGFFNKKYCLGLRHGQLYFDGLPIKGHLAFQTLCAWEGSKANLFNEIKNNLSRDKNFIKLYSLLCCILLLGIIWAIWMIKKLSFKAK